MKIRLGALTALLAAVALSFGVGTANAHTQTFPTQALAGGAALEGNQLTVVGVVQANPRCRAFRTVTLVKVLNDGSRRVVDRGMSSSRGYVGLRGNIVNAQNFFIRVVRKRIGPKTKAHRHICAGARSNNIA